MAIDPTVMYLDTSLDVQISFTVCTGVMWLSIILYMNLKTSYVVQVLFTVCTGVMWLSIELKMNLKTSYVVQVLSLDAQE